MTTYLEQRLAAALHMAECADSVCARNSHLHLARLYRLRLTTIQAVNQGRRAAHLRGSANTIAAARISYPGEPGDAACVRPEHRV